MHVARVPGRYRRPGASQYPVGMEIEFSGEIWYWRGPSPYHFITVPEEGCREIRAMSTAVSYGWGVIPVSVEIGATTFTTSLFPKDGSYLVPIKDAVRKKEGLELGATASLRLEVALRHRA